MKVAVPQQYLWFTFPLSIQGDDFAEWVFLVRVTVVFPDAVDAAVALMDRLAPISEAPLWSNGDREVSPAVPVNPLVRIIGKNTSPFATVKLRVPYSFTIERTLKPGALCPANLHPGCA